MQSIIPRQQTTAKRLAKVKRDHETRTDLDPLGSLRVPIVATKIVAVVVVVVFVILLVAINSYSTPGPVNTWMGDCLRAATSSRYVTMQPPGSTQPSIRLG